MQMGRANSGHIGSLLTLLAVSYAKRRVDAAMEALVRKLPTKLRTLLLDWNEGQVVIFGPMMSQRRLLCLLYYQDDLTLVTFCKLLADLLEQIVLNTLSLELKIRLSQKGPGSEFVRARR